MAVFTSVTVTTCSSGVFGRVRGVYARCASGEPRCLQAGSPGAAGKGLGGLAGLFEGKGKGPPGAAGDDDEPRVPHGVLVGG